MQQFTLLLFQLCAVHITSGRFKLLNEILLLCNLSAGRQVSAIGKKFRSLTLLLRGNNSFLSMYHGHRGPGIWQNPNENDCDKLSRI